MLVSYTNDFQKSLLVVCTLALHAIWLYGCSPDHAATKAAAGKGEKKSVTNTLDSCENGEHVTMQGEGGQCEVNSASSKCLVDVTNCATLKVGSVSSQAVVEVKDDKCKELIFASISSEAQIHVKPGTKITCPKGEYGASSNGIIQMGEQLVDMKPYIEQHDSYKYDGGPKLKWAEAGQSFDMDGKGGECEIGSISSAAQVRVKNCKKLKVGSLSSAGKLFIVDDTLSEFSFDSISSAAEVHLNPGAEVTKEGKILNGCKIEKDGGSKGTAKSSLVSIGEHLLRHTPRSTRKPPGRHSIDLSVSPHGLFLEHAHPPEIPKRSTGQEEADVHNQTSLSSASNREDKADAHNKTHLSNFTARTSG